jgi:N-acyl-D-amino-acid deacylase
VFDILFRNARIVDGSGAPAWLGDLAVLGDRIAAIGPLPQAQAALVIDAAAQVLCPGFIDVHVHSELEMLAGRHTAGVLMGVTTEVICPDGMSFAPLSPTRLDAYRRYVRAIYGDADVGWYGGTFAEYLARFAGRVRSNVAAQAPHGAIRLQVRGWAPGPAGDDDLEAMCRLVRECMEAGAVGLSTGLEYLPAAHADLRELVELGKVVAEYGGVCAAHIRSYLDGRRDAAIAEAVTLGEAAGVPVHISHLAGTPRMYAGVEAAHARGLDVTWDAYPYCAGCTMLAYALPPAAVPASIDELLAGLAGPALPCALRDLLEARFPADSPVYFAGLSQPHNQWMGGKRLREAWQASGLPFEEFVCRLLADEQLAPLLILPWPDTPEENEARLRHTLTHPLQMMATDGIYAGRYTHPRAWGSYPRLLGRYVRDERWLSLEDAVRRATSFPAARFGLADRGLLRPGMAADLVLLNPQTIADQATYRSPRLPPLGIRHVLVNGVPVVRDGALADAGPGRVLRRLAQRPDG